MLQRGDFIYGEIVSSDEERKSRFGTYELKKDKDGYEGTFRAGGMCTYAAPPLTWDYGSMR